MLYTWYFGCAKTIYTVHHRPYKEFQNNFTQTRFSSYVVTLEPNTRMKWNSVVAKLHVLVFSLRIWSPSAQGKGLGCWPHLLTLELLWHLIAMKSFLGTLLKKASLTSLNTILLHQSPTLSMRYHQWVRSSILLQLQLSSCLVHWNVPLTETF